MSTPSSLPNMANLTIAAPTPTFTGLPSELRDMIYLCFQALEERDNRRAKIDGPNKIVHKLPKDTRKLVVTSNRVAYELLKTCYRKHEWRATIVVNDIWKGTWDTPSRWLGLSTDNTRIHDNNIRKVRFSILYEFPKEQVELAKRKLGNVAEPWRIHVALSIHLGAPASCVVRADCSITNDVLGHAVRGASLRAALEPNIHREVIEMQKAKPAFKLKHIRGDLTIAEWRHVVDYTTNTIANWMYHVQGGWGPLEQGL